MNSRTRKIFKSAGWAVGILVGLLILLVVALYIPAVQRWATDRVIEYINSETELRAKVDHIRLRFPLHLEVGGFTLVCQPDVTHPLQEHSRDTVINLDRLNFNVRCLPLLSGKIKTDHILLCSAQLHTMNFIDAIKLNGHIGKLDSRNLIFDLTEGTMKIPNLLLDHSNLHITLPDSVAPDTLEDESGSLLRIIDLQKVQLNQVGFQLDMAPSADSTSVSLWLNQASTSCLLDLENGNYYIKPLHTKNAAINFDTGPASIAEGFDPTHINLTQTNLDIDSLSYTAEGNLYVQIRHLSTLDRSSLQVDTLSGTLTMDSTTLHLYQTRVKTPESDILLNMDMDFNAFDDINPGQFSIDAQGYAGKTDVVIFAADMAHRLNSSLPHRPIEFDLTAKGNLQKLHVESFQAKMNETFDISGKTILTDIYDPDGKIGIQSQMELNSGDISWITGLLPTEIAAKIKIPSTARLNGTATMDKGRLKAEATLSHRQSKMFIVANYDTNTDRYAIDVKAHQLQVDNFLVLSDSCQVSGHLKAHGQGFDFDSPYTRCDAIIDLQHINYGTYWIDSTDMTASLKRNVIYSNTTFNDNRLDGHFIVEGTLSNKEVDANMTLDLPFADVAALGFSNDPLTAHATHGEMKAKSNFDNLFLMDAAVEGVEVILKGDSLTTEQFNLHAETTEDSTSIMLSTSDMDFDFHAPQNLFTLVDDFTKVAETAQQQVKERSLNINQLKQIIPQATLKANMGNQNPISKFLFMHGFKYEEVVADLRTSQQYGLQGDAHIYRFATDDSMKIDTVMFNLYQDTTQISYNMSISCPEQPLSSAFNAYLTGFVSPKDIESHLTFIDNKGRKSIDLGVKGEITPDSMIHMQLYPSKPILAYRTFTLNSDNYIDLYAGNKMFANIFMDSETDSCNIAVYAQPVDSQLQNIETSISNLNLAELAKVLPFVPEMTGLLNIDANYVVADSGSTINGLASIENFSYETFPMGDLMTMFDYHPIGEDGHDINAMLFSNDQHIGVLKGNYNILGPDYLDASLVLDQLPLSMANAFASNLCSFDGMINGIISVSGPTDTLLLSGYINPQNVHIFSDIYSFNLSLANEPITFQDSYINFNNIQIFGAGQNPLTINGYVDFANLSDMAINLSLYGQNFLVFDAPRTRKTALFGKLYGDFFARVIGTPNDLHIRGLVNVLNSTDITYIMTNTPLSVDYRLDDIVTFVDFSVPPNQTQREPHTFMGIDMLLNLEIEDGVQARCEFSADKQSYVNVQGRGSMTMSYSPEGVLNFQGRYTVNEGEMKYTLPIIPLKTFTLQKGSYVEFTGRPDNPTMNITATEQTKANVSNADGSSRSVLFNVGLKITNTLENMGLQFTIDAPEDIAVQNELASLTLEEKNKLAVALLATGMYLSSTNESGFSTTNALNNFLQNEINNIAGKAVSTAVKVDMSIGMEQTRRDDGTTRTDYAFKFTKRFFSDRLNVIIGGRINADGNNRNNESGAYIDDISLEWRLDNGGTQYVRLFHDKNYDNLVEGELIENGAGIVLRKSLDSLSELFIWKKKKDDKKK